jgi:signal transduction histidine kinase
VRLARGGYPAYLAEALSEAGRAAALAGEPARARRLLDESIALAERRGARCDAAQALLARGEVGRALGWPGAAEEEARAREALRALDPPPHPSPAPAPAAEGAAPPPTLSLIDRFSTVLEAGRRIASQLSREPIFTATLDAARALLRAEACAIVEVGREPSSGAAPAGAAAEAAVPARRAAGATPVAASGGAGAGASAALLARALAAGRPVVAREGAGPEGDGLLAAGVRSALCAPIHVRGAPVACLCATHRSVAGLFGATEERLAEFVAAIAGAALENAEGFARVEALGRSLEASVADLTDANAEVRRLGAALARGQEEERRRVALAIHDSAEQELIALAIEVERAAGRAVDAPAVAGLKSSIGRILEGLRRLSHDLRPGALDRLGLSAALADLARSLTSDALAVDFAAEGEGAADRDAVPGEAATAAYRIAQAALANVVRHARARRARVRLRVAPPSLRLEVEDDGAGFDPERLPPGRGLGLVGMRERAGWLGGSFAVESAPGRGARIALELPIPGRDPA